MNRLAKTLNSITKKFGYRLIKIEKIKDWSESFVGITSFEKKTINICSKFSMTGYDRLFFLVKAINHVHINKVKGDFVECGVWKGGNLILFQRMIEKLKINNKKIYAFDTFEGMNSPGEFDYSINNESAKKILIKLKNKNVDPNKNIILAKCDLQNVLKNYHQNTKKNKNLITIKGEVEKTLKTKKNLPDKISILRLDTDWYSSTKIELETLFPRLSNNGLLIIDDYGYWKGSKKAVDDYFKNKNLNLFKIDFTGRYLIKK